MRRMVTTDQVKDLLPKGEAGAEDSRRLQLAGEDSLWAGGVRDPGGGGKTTASVEGRKKTGGSKSPDVKVREGHGTGASAKKSPALASGGKNEGWSSAQQHREDETDNDLRVPEDIAQVLAEQFHSEPQAVDEYVPFG